MTEFSSLERQAAEFADELTDTVNAVSPNCSPFVAKAIQDGSRFTVSQTPAEGVPLKVDQKPLLSMTARYWCTVDRAKRFLAVERSDIAVYPGVKARGEPLFRYEYLREARDVPAAHIQVHGHRDALSHVLSRSGTSTNRGKRRATGDDIPRMSELHLPVGGHRFRPCLEDILEMLLDEFGIDGAAESRATLQSGRKRWRMTQTSSAVRDDPDSAVSVLKELGYHIELADGEDAPLTNESRLTAR